MPSTRVSIFSILLLAVLIRGGVCFTQLHRFDADPDAYRIISQTLATTGVYGIDDGAGSAKPTAFRPPLYPYVLSWMVKGGQLSNFAVACLHVILGAITVALTFRIAQRCLPDDHRNLLPAFSALLVAIDPILVQQSTVVMTETLATALSMLAIWWWVARCENTPTIRSAMVLGLLMSLAYLCRPTFLVWAALMVLVVLITTDLPWPKRAMRAGAFGIVIALTVVGWTVRNQKTMGHPVWATTHGGYTLLLANNPSFYDYLQNGRFGTPWDANPFLIAYSHRYDGDPSELEFWKRDWVGLATNVPAVSEVADDRRCYDAARATIDRNPKVFLWSCLVRAARLWSPLPHLSADRSVPAVYAVGIYYVAFTAILIVGAWRLRRRGRFLAWWPAITLVIALSFVHAIYWSNLRMRAPVIPVFSVVAAAAFLPRRIEPTTDPPPG